MKTATVLFTTRYGSGSSKTYDYVVEDSVEVVAGNHAVVHNGTEFAIVFVESVTAGVSAKATKSLVTVIDQKMCNDYVANCEKVAEAKRLYRRLNELLETEYENNKYRILAQSNKEAAELLTKLGIDS